MRRLIFVMSNCGMIDVTHFVESKLAIEFKTPVALGRVVSTITIGGEFAHPFVPRLLMDPIENSPRASAAEVLQSGIRHSQPTQYLSGGRAWGIFDRVHQEPGHEV